MGFRDIRERGFIIIKMTFKYQHRYTKTSNVAAKEGRASMKRLANHGKVWINGTLSKTEEPWESRNYIFIHGLCKECKGPLKVS